jgi:hypothetical protein
MRSLNDLVHVLELQDLHNWPKNLCANKQVDHLTCVKIYRNHVHIIIISNILLLFRSNVLTSWTGINTRLGNTKHSFYTTNKSGNHTLWQHKA